MFKLITKTGILVMFLILGLSACSSSSTGGNESAVATVTGRVIDGFDNPVALANITINNDPLETQTNSDGQFSFTVSAGTHQILVNKYGNLISVVCMTAVEGVTHDLGDIGPGMSDSCTTGTPTAGDSDGDGLFDTDELLGWNVTITLGSGSVETRHVDSDPDIYDTDGDGLNDALEMAARTDPRRIDTDGDLLSDYAELNVYKSHPTKMDSDGDSCDPNSDESTCDSDPNLLDGIELTLSKTSPTLDDTDGDGFSDYEEINTGGTNPNLANLPSLALELSGDPLIELEVDYTTGTSAHSEELAREETGHTKTDTESTKMSIENTIDIKTHSEVGTSAWPPSFNATIDTETKFQHGYFHNTSSSWKQSSVSESQENYQTWVDEQVSFDDGKLGVAVKVLNLSDLSFKLDDLRVIAYRQTGGGRFSLIGTMAPEEEWPEDGFVLGPSAELTMTMAKEHIGAEVMRALVKDPTALLFDVGSYSLFQLDEWGVNETVNYAILGENVLQRTGLIVIDYGNGQVDKHMVATNVFRNPDGSGRGLTLKEALEDVIGLDYEVRTEFYIDDEGNTVTGNQVLYRIKNVKAYDRCNENSDAYDPAIDCENLHPKGFWMVGGTGESFEKGDPIDFEAIALHNGERINLTYLEDTDGDGVFNREEYLLGTRNDLVDTDGDAISDYDETRTGWEVAVQGKSPYWTYPDPRFSDVDHDFLSDNTESHIGTDPYLSNTDGDEQEDTTDPFPLSPPCLDGEKLNLVAWWDGSSYDIVNDHFAEDIWILDLGGIASDGLMHSDDGNTLTIDILGDPGFQFNPYPDQNDQYIDVAVQADDGLSPTKELSLSLLVYWEGVATGKEWSTLISKGIPNGETYAPDKATYAVSVNSSGQLKFSLYRNAHRKCWGWFFGWVDDFCSDDTVNETVELISDVAIDPQVWYDISLTFIGETMSIYIDGDLVDSRSTYSDTWTSGNLQYQVQFTYYLIENDNPLRIGGEFSLETDPSPVYPYRGLMDEIQLFGRGLNADEVNQLNHIGVCLP